MASKKQQKLELTWIGKGEEPTLEPRILIENPEYSYGDPNTENLLIHGDNLLALKALEQDYTGKVKCIYIDPPYNTGSAFEYYDDNVEHSIWLDLMKQRLVLLKNLLSKDGFICCHIDDSEGHYLKVLMDEVFGRSNYLTTFYIRVRYPDKTLKQDMNFHKEVEQIHIYRKEYGSKPNLNKQQNSFDKFNYYFKELSSGREVEMSGKKVVIFKSDEYEIIKDDGSEDGRKEIWATGSILDGNSSGRFFRDNLTGRYEDDGYGVMYKVYGIGDDKFDFRYFTGPKKIGATKGKYFQGVPNSQLNDKEGYKEVPINNYYDLAGSFGNCRLEGGVAFRSGKKPEALLEVILKHFSNEDDIVLDSFLGSGSTAASALKMNRKFIGVELGDHAYSLCYERLKKVSDKDDKTGISKNYNWSDNSGFKFYELAPSLLNKDKYDNWVISKEYNPDMLAAAMAKQEGFTYAPDKDNYWKQGYSAEQDFILTTTQFVTVELLDQLQDQLQDGESLLICAKKFQPECHNKFKNIVLKKIPKMLLGKCEFGKDDYSLNIINPPVLTEEELGDE
ncbi:site-specific DNA-methyltransferase [Algibacter lectus]|uniref:site-specific DNA-methyltransferase n=1 Tax=Algibacter lectus TaxID=221126 RepID=UPI0024955015|nr:site-specific DNA-methyltransferase [Algibacter lectus]